MCDKVVLCRGKSQNMSKRCRDNFKDTDAIWLIVIQSIFNQKINISTEDEVFHFASVYSKIEEREQPVGKVRSNCRITNRNSMIRRRKLFGEIKVTFYLITW